MRFFTCNTLDARRCPMRAIAVNQLVKTPSGTTVAMHSNNFGQENRRDPLVDTFGLVPGAKPHYADLQYHTTILLLLDGNAQQFSSIEQLRWIKNTPTRGKSSSNNNSTC